MWTKWYQLLAGGMRMPRTDAPGDTALAGRMTLPLYSQPLNEFAPEQFVDRPLGDETLFGYNLNGETFQPGAPLVLDLYWSGAPEGAQTPITVRMPCGGTPGSGPFHSQSVEAIYSHYPGCIVLTPATVADAHQMLIEGIAMDDPVIFCEHKLLYRWLKSESYEGDGLPIGKARIIRSGKHATVVAYSAMVHEAVRAADMLKEEGGWEIEVVDLRSVKPIDTDTIMASVARTGRLLAVGEAFPWGGVTAEVVSRITAEGFHLLDAPPVRLNAKDCPIPYHPKLWAAHRPTPESISYTLKKLLAY